MVTPKLASTIFPADAGPREPAPRPPEAHSPSRRRVMTVGGAAAAVLVTGGGSVARARPPRDEAGRPADQPGHYGFPVGRFRVIALSDGTFDLDADSLLRNITPRRLHDRLHDSFLTSPIESSNNCYLIDTGEHVVLVDAGAGDLLGPGTGRLPVTLRAAGYTPNDIDVVVLTHLHQDHVGGLLVHGRPLFPRARILVERREAAEWLDPAKAAQAPESSRAVYADAQRSVRPYRARLTTFAAGDRIVPGVTAVDEPGHTPGHSGFRVRDRGQELLVWGDIVHLAEVQFAEPGVAIAFDSSTTLAVQARADVFAAAARARHAIAGAHLPFPGIGHVRAVSAGYEYVRADYSIRVQ